MSSESPSIIVLGGLNTDIILSRTERLLGPGELTTGEELSITPGGKSRNMAQMIAQLTRAGTVAMIGRTCRDRFGFWNVPFEALQKSGVNVDHVRILEDQNLLPGIALIPVDRQGKNQIYLYPGVNAGFCPDDIDKAQDLFAKAGEQNGILVLSLEMPIATAMHGISVAKCHRLRVALDPGGISPQPTEEQRAQYAQLLGAGLDLLKANEHETEVLTGMCVTDLASAAIAARRLRDMGVVSTVITAGAQGAFLVDGSTERHFRIPSVNVAGNNRDETGCGDQSMAAICAMLQEGKSLEEAVETGVLAGTLQFHCRGVQPLTREDLDRH